MHNFFKHKKTGKIITRDEYMNQVKDNVETNALDMAETGMDLNSDVFGVKGDYEPYEPEENETIED
ncbi:hypothetical protein [Enterococcus ureasiticus]|uniref:Uncharacterized protein n=1 Tax=Enterococcus ureasiticus TaxID=903984 RepID=A0A1E5GLG8_9ENTE|nr:hypothetical protein [Enterococcus ureasiticus]OEG13455.1 hypothetical protein BCR21_00225 [Enterococcus ureasiticus]